MVDEDSEENNVDSIVSTFLQIAASQVGPPQALGWAGGGWILGSRVAPLGQGVLTCVSPPPPPG